MRSTKMITIQNIISRYISYNRSLSRSTEANQDQGQNKMLHGRPQHFTDRQFLDLLYDMSPSTKRKTGGIPVSCIVLQVSLRWHYPDQISRSVAGATLSA
jgi:hypothetical protein